MIKVVNAEQMREIDRVTIEDIGIPGIVLMENAGAAVVDSLQEKFPDIVGKRVTVFAGKGNNGGDGFVIARRLTNIGATATVYLVGKRDKITGDAKISMDSWMAMGGAIKELDDPRKLKNFKLKFMHSSIVVDALLGTGINDAPRGFYVDIIELINDMGAFVVSVDVPSGMDSDSGVIKGACVKADLTVTFGLPKVGLVTSPARNYAGNIAMVDISIPESVTAKSPCMALLLQSEDIPMILPNRSLDAHKGQFGHLVIAGGSMGLGGAVAMAGMGALRVGVGLVTASVPECIASSYVTAPVEMMTLPLQNDNSGAISEASLDRFLKFAADKTAALIGPGLTSGESQSNFVVRAMAGLEIPLIIDADGLNCIGEDRELITKRTAPTIITPHPGEMAKLTGMRVAQIQADRISVAKEYATSTGSIVVLKGAGTVIAMQEGDVYINHTGNNGLATGGSGDVLSGMIAGLLAAGAHPKDAAIASVFIHGQCADTYASERDTRSLLPSDILEMLPTIMSELSKKNY